MTREEILLEAINRISALDPEKDSPEGWNEWGEADCFQQAQRIARMALSKVWELKGSEFALGSPSPSQTTPASSEPQTAASEEINTPGIAYEASDLGLKWWD